MGGTAIAPTAALLEIASAAVATLTSQQPSLQAVLSEVMLPASFVLPRLSAAAKAELLCVVQAGQVEVWSEDHQRKAKVHLRARVTAVSNSQIKAPTAQLPQQRASPAVNMLAALVMEGAGMCHTDSLPASTDSNDSNMISGDSNVISSDSNMSSRLTVSSAQDSSSSIPASSQHTPHACVSAAIDPVKISQAAGARYCCVQDGGVDGRLLSLLDFEGALQV